MKLKIDWKALLIAARKAALAGTAAILATGVQAAPLGFQAGNEITVRMKSHGRRAARGIGWESGRLARSMDGPYAAPATDGTSVVPVRRRLEGGGLTEKATDLKAEGDLR